MKKRAFIRLLCLAGTLALLSGFSAGALPGFSRSCFSIISEPEQTSSLVQFYQNGAAADASRMTWVEARGGKALSLDGESEYLRVGYQQLKLNKFTFSTWIYWKGVPPGKPAARQYGQSLFTLSRYKNNWLTVSPLVKDASHKHPDGGILNGVYVGFRFGGNNGTSLEQFNAATSEVAYGIPQQAWHHLAVTADGQTLRTYIDGVLWFEDILMMSLVELSALNMTIGAGIFEEPPLYALLDDTALYDSALTSVQIALLAANVDISQPDPTMPPAAAPYLPTAPPAEESSVSSKASETVVQPPSLILGLPAPTFFLITGILVVFGGLSVLLSIRQARKGGGH